MSDESTVIYCFGCKNPLTEIDNYDQCLRGCMASCLQGNALVRFTDKDFESRNGDGDCAATLSDRRGRARLVCHRPAIHLIVRYKTDGDPVETAIRFLSYSTDLSSPRRRDRLLSLSLHRCEPSRQTRAASGKAVSRVNASNWPLPLGYLPRAGKLQTSLV
jgi:hypothetical protein